MNNLILVLIAILLLGTTVALAGKHRHGGARMMHGGPMEAMARHFDLSEEQQAAIRQSFENSREQARRCAKNQCTARTDHRQHSD